MYTRRTGGDGYGGSCSLDVCHKRHQLVVATPSPSTLGLSHTRQNKQEFPEETICLFIVSEDTMQGDSGSQKRANRPDDALESLSKVSRCGGYRSCRPKDVELETRSSPWE
ncbi:hypothetical protein J6590_098376 [Homalodisca vitripennis]|nr:hypothetical protein J6590_078822 [Homalodisca vitripennis]KAG8334043.1 hypothetical protein J6590_098376 [Homalodisca vitripennis]